MRVRSPTGSVGLTEPISAPLHRLLRLAALEHAQGLQMKRIITPQLHVGLPGGLQHVHQVGEGETDHALRTDMVAIMAGALAQQIQPWAPLVWLTRSAPLTPAEDLDLSWLAAATSAYAELDLPLIFVVVARHGWHDPRSDLGRSWSRLRPRSRQPS